VLKVSLPPTHPASGAWQLAHDWFPRADKDVSKNKNLPRRSRGVSGSLPAWLTLESATLDIQLVATMTNTSLSDGTTPSSSVHSMAIDRMVHDPSMRVRLNVQV
jgi:hypothetical protein